LVGKSEGKSSLGRPMSKWEDNMKMDSGRVWIGFVWLRIEAISRLL
jgi:hypothetical protein